MDGKSIEGIKQNMQKGRGNIGKNEIIVGLNEEERIEYEKRQKSLKRPVGRPAKNDSGWTTVG